MTLSQIIKLRTNSGRAIADFLVDVMHDRYKDFRICHRLQAARLLTTYGNEDAPNFIAENTSESSPRRDRPNSKRQTKFDTELARLIRQDTDDGRSIARFLVNVMEGELRTFQPHHRMAAARELLNRGFAKTAHTDPEPGRPTRTHLHGLTEVGAGLKPAPATMNLNQLVPSPTEGDPLVHPDPVEGHPTPNRRSSEGTACPVLDTGSPRTPIRGRNPETPPPSDAQPARTEPERVRPARTPLRHSRESGNPPAGSPLGHPGAGDPLTPHSSPLTPQEADGLAHDLLDTLHHLPPQHFEHTILDLLENMGYGHARYVGRTGDGDIDGIIDQDTLGLDRLYIQAKRWTNQVGEPEIMNFSGSLDPHGANRGILITTSDFTDTARKTAKTISIGNKHIRLVNGHELAHLMLEHNIRVTPDTTQHSRKQDKNHHTHHT